MGGESGCTDSSIQRLHLLICWSGKTNSVYRKVGEESGNFIFAENWKLRLLTFCLLLSNYEWCLSYSAVFGVSDTGMGLHRLAFAPVILTQTTPEQLAKWQPEMEAGRMIGCYAQTEIGHGKLLLGSVAVLIFTVSMCKENFSFHCCFFPPCTGGYLVEWNMLNCNWYIV